MSVSLRRKNRLHTMLKRIGPNTDPCGTPFVMFVQELKAVSIFFLFQQLVY